MTEMTPKEIGRRMKARGLKRLRWYCQRCEKQCGDENGFKSHCSSAGHIRQMALFRENAASEMNEYTRRFVSEFMSALKRKGGQRVSANRVYQEHIADRHHTHLNSTIFDSLTSFILYLNKENLADADCDERGEWFIKLIDRDPRTLARAAEDKRRDERRRASEEAEAKAQNERAAMSPPLLAAPLKSPSVRDDPEQIKRLLGEKIALSFAGDSSVRAAHSRNDIGDVDPLSAMIAPRTVQPQSDVAGSGLTASRKRPSALDELMRETEQKKHIKVEASTGAGAAVNYSGLIAPLKTESVSTWLRAGIVVKLMRRGDADYKAKAVVVSVSGSDAVARVIVSGRILSVNDSDVETVIPSVGRDVIIVRGRLSGERATLLALTADGLRGRLIIRSGDEIGNAVDADFDDFCKVNE